MPWGNSVIAYKSRGLLAILIFSPSFQQHMDSFQQYLFNYQQKRQIPFLKQAVKEGAGDLQLINPCGRIPLIFQCTLGSREVPKWGTENSLCNREVAIPHLPEPSLPQELKSLNPALFCHWQGAKRAKMMISVWNWVCLGSTEKSQCCVPRPAAMRWQLEAHTGLSILSQHLGAVFLLFPSGSAALWDQGFAEGNPREYWGIQVILTAAHTRNQEPRTDVLDPFVPMIRKPPSPPPQNKFTVIKSIIRLPNEPELHWYPASWGNIST